MAMWRGDRYATTAQLAEFYQVSLSTVRNALNSFNDELRSDGLIIVAGADLRDVRPLYGLPSKTSKAALWPARAALRLGMVLCDSPIAKAVRTALLDAVEAVPQIVQSQEPVQQIEPAVSVEVINQAAALLGRIYGPHYAQRMVQVNLRKHYPAIALPPVAPDEMPALPSPEATLTPTKIAIALGMKGKSGCPDARGVNRLLEEIGYQVRYGGDWSPTAKGLEHCRRNPVSRPDQMTDKEQLLWYPSILDVLRDALARRQ